MIQNDRQLEATKCEIASLEGTIARKIARKIDLGDDMIIASWENMLAQMRTEVKQYLSSSSAPTDHEGEE